MTSQKTEIGKTLSAVEDRIAGVADPENGVFVLHGEDKRKLREAIVRETLIEFFRRYPKIVREILRA